MELMTELLYLNLISNGIRNMVDEIPEHDKKYELKKELLKKNEKFILNMYKKGYTLNQIADVVETGVDEIEAIIKKRAPIERERINVF